MKLIWAISSTVVFQSGLDRSNPPPAFCRPNIPSPCTTHRTTLERFTHSRILYAHTVQASSDMDIEEEDFGCLGAPTEAQMWEQHVALVQAEYEQVSAELRHARANIAKLIEMNATTEAQRNEALRLIESHRRDLSAAHVEISALGNRYRGMLMAERQRAESPFPFAESVPAVRHD